MPLARGVVKDLAVEHSACIRPIQLRRTDLATGEVATVLVPCGHTLASVCPSCAERAKNLRAAQCREGWHLDQEPVIEPDDPTDEQAWLIQTRADAQAARDTAEAHGEDVTGWDEELADLDDEINNAGMRGNVLPKRPVRRHRSTRRRQDAPPLPKRATRARSARPTPRRTARPSGRRCSSRSLVRPTGGSRPMGRRPTRPPTTTSRRRATRCTSPRSSTGSCRTCAGSPDTTSSTSPRSSRNGAWPRTSTSQCAAPSHAELRKVIAATYHQVWWPSTDTVYFDGSHLPVWDEDKATYLDPATGELLPTWDEALDAIGDEDQALHVARFGNRFDAQGVLAGSKDANRCIGYLTKYLTKHVADCHAAQSEDQVRHVDRLADALRFEPCSPTCANWLRYGVQPKNAKPGMRPGACKGKAHRREYLGYAGRRVLVSRKWSGKTLADHRADRKNWLMETLGLPATDPDRYTWEPVTPGDQDHVPTARRLLHVVADRIRWQHALDEARRRAQGLPSDNFSATGQAA
jgi:hypothetical protein